MTVFWHPHFCRQASKICPSSIWARQSSGCEIDRSLQFLKGGCPASLALVTLREL